MTELYHTERMLLARALRNDGYGVMPRGHMGLEKCRRNGWLKNVHVISHDLILCRITDAGRAAMEWPKYAPIYEAEYGGNLLNFHVFKSGEELNVELVYPPWENDPGDGRCRYVVFDQEAVRASDGIRLHYDYGRDGYAVEQPRPRLVGTATKNSYDEVTDWVEVGFFSAWSLTDREEGPTQVEYDRADAEHHELIRGKK